MFTSVLVAFLAIFLVSRFLRYKNGLEEVGHIPGIRGAFGTLSAVGVLGPTTWWNPGVNFPWGWRNKIYERYNADIFSIVPAISGRPNVYTRSMDAMRQVALPLQPQYVKPPSVKLVLRMWGESVISTDGDDWKRHRRIVAPAFTSKTYDVVWSETSRLYYEMLESENFMHRTEPIAIPVVNKLTFKLALFVIASAGFGLRVVWSEPPSSEDMTLQEAFRIFATTTQLRVILPKWAFKLPIKSLRRIDSAYRTMGNFMNNAIAEGKKEAELAFVPGESLETLGENVFSRLIIASEREGSGLGLNDDELRGSVFAMLFAGHETTAHTLAATITFLGLYQDEQDIVYKSIREIIPAESEPTIDDYARLEKVRACFLETIRLFPSGSILSRDAAQDLVLNIPPTGSSRSSDAAKVGHYHIKKGTQVIVDLIGINYNAEYFPEPEAYKPSRWYETDPNVDPEHPKETTTAEAGFTSFSIGPRVCIGKKFAMTEATCFLTHLVRDYKIDIGDLMEGESREQWRERHMQATMGFTLQPSEMPVVLTKRG